jgi:NAD-dependent deacetylase
MWDSVDPFEVASLSAFRYHPERFYAWVRPLARTIFTAEPNAAHHALSTLEARGRLRTIITQNIDALHQRAGSQSVLELHGHLREATCGQCHHVVATDSFMTRFIEEGTVPLCTECGGVLKPNVILMEEHLPEGVLSAARAAAQSCDVMIVAGSSLEVMPAGALPFEAVARGAKLIIANIGPTYMDERADVRLHADVVESLPKVAAAVMAMSYG